MLNQVILVGRISHTIENGTLTLAVPRSFKNSEGEYETDFIPVRLFGNIATTTAEYTKVGDIVGIKGRIQQTQSNIEIIADRVTFLSSSSSSPTKDNPSINEGEI